jgi:hypothetical protein
VTSSTSEIGAYLDEVEPYEFEQFVADVWEELGYRTEVTSGSQDRAIDVVAEQDTPVKQKMLIQAKAYSEGNRIGSGEVRDYATLYQQDDDVDRVVLVTTSGFTTPAKELAQDLDVAAIDRGDLIGLIDDAGMAPEVEPEVESESEGPNDDDIAMWLPMLLTGILVGAILIMDQLYDRGMLSEDFTAFVLIAIIAVFLLVVHVIGWLNRNGRIDL